MSLQPGALIGPYRVLAALGAGGMGEVYRARDLTLDRDVAIKVLPASFAGDAERLMRFEREARTLASLNHPHIAQVYGLERSTATSALIMELVEGEDLAAQIARSPIAPDDTFAIARQIAEALEAAHGTGIIHRDLKPANIKVRSDGTVKVLDFGLAKTVVLDERKHAATITSPAMTVHGMILGTAAYMSPEQATGKPVDRRTDIWAFGCVVYEMLTGRRAFEANSVTETIGAVLHQEPDWSALDPKLPPRIRVVLERCLQKDPRQRVHDMADVKLAMAGAFDAPAASGQAPAASGHSTASVWRYAFVAAAALAIGALVGGALGSRRDTAPPAPDQVRVVLTTADAPSLKISPNALDLAISPDGRRVMYATWAAGGGFTARALNQLHPAVLLQGREASISPFVSPDGAWLAFNDLLAGTIEKVPIEGGPALTMFRHGTALRGASWADDGSIVFGDSALGPGGLFHVPEGGREPQVLTTPDPKKAEVDHRWPHVLPGSRAVLFTRLIGAAGGTPRSEIALLDRQTGEQRLLMPEGTNPYYSASGHLVYGVNDTLRAVAFDVSTLQVRGTPVPVLEGVLSKPEGGVNFSLSSNGSLAYIMAPAETQRGRPVWVSRTGREEGALVSADLTLPEYPRLSPDGRRAALIVSGDIWVHDLNGAPPTRLTSGGVYLSPIWSADGRHIVVEHSTVGLAAIAVAGTEQKTHAISVAGHFHPVALSRDGRVLAVEIDRKTSEDSQIRPSAIVSWQIEKPDAREDVVALPGRRDGFDGATVSPDGRWLAYVSQQTGQAEIWVRPYPGSGTPIRVSPSGGTEPVWSRRGDELYYFEGRRLMAVPVVKGSTFTFKSPTFLFESHYLVFGQPPSYDVAEDGRFLMMRAAASQARTSPQVVVVLNWADELRRRVPTR